MIETKFIVLNASKCVQCGICSSICSYGALTLERPEMTVRFKPEYCQSCGMCVKVCPVHAVETD